MVIRPLGGVATEACSVSSQYYPVGNALIDQTDHQLSDIKLAFSCSRWRFFVRGLPLRGLEQHAESRLISAIPIVTMANKRFISVSYFLGHAF